MVHVRNRPWKRLRPRKDKCPDTGNIIPILCRGYLVCESLCDAYMTTVYQTAASILLVRHGSSPNNRFVTSSGRLSIAEIRRIRCAMIVHVPPSRAHKVPKKYIMREVLLYAIPKCPVESRHAVWCHEFHRFLQSLAGLVYCIVCMWSQVYLKRAPAGSERSVRAANQRAKVQNALFEWYAKGSFKRFWAIRTSLWRCLKTRSRFDL